MSNYKGPPIIDISTERKVILGIALATILIITGGVWFIGKQEVKEKEKLSKPLMGEEPQFQGANHVNRGDPHPTYSSNPPASGWHWGDGVAGAGVHDEEVPDELLIHSMEHGAVILHYKAGLSQEQVEQIKAAYNMSRGRKILVPRKNLDVPVALTSWGRIMKLEAIDAAKIKEFIETNENRAPEKATNY